MNFLAHLYLSDNDKEITIGNFIADAIKGKKYLEYPPRIAKGIVLHRAIDTFTDAHPTFRKSTSKLHKTHSHYSGVIVDVLYDHFLAKNWADYHEQPLAQFAQNFYAMIQENFDILPTRIQRMIPYMIADNWLLSYTTVEGVDKILGQMNMRTKGIGKMDKAVITLQEHYEELEAEFSSFFEELIQFSNQKLLEL